MRDLGLSRGVNYRDGRTGVVCLGVLVVYVNQMALRGIILDEDFDVIICVEDGRIVSALDEGLLNRNISELNIHLADDGGMQEIRYDNQSYNIISRSLSIDGVQGDLQIIALYSNERILSRTRPIAFMAYGLIMFGAAASLVAIYVLSRILTAHETKLQKQQLETHQKDIQLQVLGSQINPHFLFNAMESLRMKAVILGQREAADDIKLLSSFMRKSLYASNEPVALAEELNFVEDYLRIQKMRFSEHLSYRIDVKLDSERYIILPFLLQPLVENAIRHGIEESGKAGGYVILSIHPEDNMLTARVADNGVGIEADVLEKLTHTLSIDENKPPRGHIGLANVNRRVRLYYGEAYGLEIQSTVGSGTIVTLRLPLVERW
jgi:two-component system sensor histidine kinase YesM